MLTTIDIWNRLTNLRHPSMQDVERAAGNSMIRVFSDESICWQVAPNLVVDFLAGEEPRKDSEVASLEILFAHDYFVAETSDDVKMCDLPNLKWNGIILPTSAAALRKSIRARTAEKLTLVTDNDQYGGNVRWQIRAGALKFIFTPTALPADPEYSKTESIGFSFRIQHLFSLGPLLSAT